MFNMGARAQIPIVKISVVNFHQYTLMLAAELISDKLAHKQI